jgi:broad specificity phosphatase PhoE
MSLDLKDKKMVYIIRHGQSEDNLRSVFQRPEAPLTKLGIEQAKLIANRLSDTGLDVILSSPYQRAYQTAKIIGKKINKSVYVKDFLKEIVSPKNIQGKEYTDQIASTKWRKWEKTLTREGIKFEDGENYQEQIQRADQILDYLKNLPFSKIALVSHGYIIRSLIFRAVLDKSLNPEILQKIQYHIKSENTGISILFYANDFEQDYSFRLLTYNDHSHFN